jgi:hypothetical protein
MNLKVTNLPILKIYINGSLEEKKSLKAMFQNKNKIIEGKNIFDNFILLFFQH